MTSSSKDSPYKKKRPPLNDMDNPPVTEHLIPVLSPEVEQKCVDGVYPIDLPTLVDGKVQLGEGYAPTIQFKCNSLYCKRPNEVCRCNSVVKTIVGRGRGDQTEIVECGKCRTAYVIRQKYDENGKLYINTSVWNTPRNLDKFCRVDRDRNYGVWVKFNKADDPEKEKNDK